MKEQNQDKYCNTSYCLFYGINIALNAIMSIAIISVGFDFFHHNQWAIDRYLYGFDFSNLYHNGVAFIYMFSGDIRASASFFVFMMRMLYTIIVHYTVVKLFPDAKPNIVILIVTITTLGSSLPNIIFSGNFIYDYAFGLNLWHNPTTFTVMPFVILSFYLLLRIIEKIDIKNIILLTLANLLSVYGKGSWFPVFSLAVLIYLFISLVIRKKSLKQVIQIGICFIPSGLYIIYVSTSTIYSTNIILGITSYVRLFPVFLNFIFPILVTTFLYKVHKKINIQLCIAWLISVISILKAVFLVEVGREYYGNMTWSVSYALVVLFMVSLIELFKYITTTNKRNIYVDISLTLGFIHLTMGVYYAFQMYFTGRFLF